MAEDNTGDFTARYAAWHEDEIDYICRDGHGHRDGSSDRRATLRVGISYDAARPRILVPRPVPEAIPIGVSVHASDRVNPRPTPYASRSRPGACAATSRA